MISVWDYFQARRQKKPFNDNLAFLFPGNKLEALKCVSDQWWRIYVSHCVMFTGHVYCLTSEINNPISNPLYWNTFKDEFGKEGSSINMSLVQTCPWNCNKTPHAIDSLALESLFGRFPACERWKRTEARLHEADEQLETVDRAFAKSRQVETNLCILFPFAAARHCVSVCCAHLT